MVPLQLLAGLAVACVLNALGGWLLGVSNIVARNDTPSSYIVSSLIGICSIVAHATSIGVAVWLLANVVVLQ